MKDRIYFLDHLRTLMIFLVILYHAGFVYTSGLLTSWIVVDPSKNENIGLIGMYLDLFVMFMLFFISGYFLPGSLQSRGSWQFIKVKFRRIMVPWIIAVLTLIPAYKYLFLYSRGLPQEPWMSYFHWFTRADADPALFSNNPAQNWLWFLPVLFLFQTLYVIMNKVNLTPSRISIRNAVIAIMVAGVAWSMVISTTIGTGWIDTALVHFQKERILPYFLIFMLGALCQKHQVFESRLSNKRLYIGVNVGLTLGLGVYTVVALNLFFNMIDPTRDYYFISPFMDRTVYYFTVLLSMFSFLYLLLHGFRNGLNRTNAFWNTLSQNSYSVYIIHMIVLGLIALALKDFSGSVFLKYSILAVSTFILSNVLVYIYRLIKERMGFPKMKATGIIRNYPE